MPSRKRNKGKDRKAKKVAEVNSMWVTWARGESDEEGIKFNHGGVLTIPDNNNHPVVKFLDTLSMTWIERSVGVPICNVDNMRITYQKHRQVWNNENYRGMVRAFSYEKIMLLVHLLRGLSHGLNIMTKMETLIHLCTVMVLPRNSEIFLGQEIVECVNC